MSLWGELFCPKCDNYLFFNIIYINALAPILKIRSVNRIGPHNINILYFIFGSLLGDGYAERHGNGTRICFQQEGSHSAYLLWLHKYVSDLGYCNESLPKLSTRLGNFGKIRTVLRFKTFTYSSFNWIEDCFYKTVDAKSFLKKDIEKPSNSQVKIKILPSCIEEYLSPMALAV